jgi:hypothetical protein
MSKFFICVALLILTACATDSMTAFNQSVAACGGQKGVTLPSSNFYKPKTKQQVETFYSCINREYQKAVIALGAIPSDEPMLVMNMQESLWHQVVDKTLSAAQAQQEYTIFMQKMAAQEQQAAESDRMLRTLTAPTTTTCSTINGTTNCMSW